MTDFPDIAARELATYYAKRAAEYDEIYRKPERQADLRLLEQIVIQFARDRDILEVACGTGYWTTFMSESARSIHATDFNEEVLDIARSKSYREGIVTFEQDDAYNINANGNYDAGFAGFWLSHVPRERALEFVRGLNRRLLPNSPVMMIDNSYVAQSSTPISRCDSFGNTYQTRTLKDGSQHEVLKNFWTAEELRALLDQSGSSVEVSLLEYYWALNYRTP